MKLTFGKRLVLFLHWFCSVLLIAAVACQMVTAKVLALLESLIGSEYLNISLIAVAVIYAVLSIAAVCVIFRRGTKRSERGFITVDASDTGKVRITVSAVEQMVKQAVGAIDGIAEMKISIESSDDAISICVNTVIVSGAHVPTVTLNMQRAIRQFVEMNCGVAVRTVAVNVQSVTNPSDGRKGRKADAHKVSTPVPEYYAPVAPAAAAEPEAETVSETVYAPVEEPVQQEIYAEAVAETEPAAEAVAEPVASEETVEENTI